MFEGKQERLNKKFLNACRYGNVEEARAALKEGADIHATLDGDTALYLALAKGRIATAEMLEQEGFNINAHKNFLLPRICNQIQSVEFLLERGANINAPHAGGDTALHVAASWGIFPVVKMLVEKGADVSIRGWRGMTARNRASQYGETGIADYLLEQEKKLGAKNLPALPAPRMTASTGWFVTGSEEITHVTDKPSTPYRITETFNFSAGTYSRLTRNMETNMETETLRWMEECPDAFLEEPLEELKKHGAATSATLPWRHRINKQPSLGAALQQ